MSKPRLLPDNVLEDIDLLQLPPYFFDDIVACLDAYGRSLLSRTGRSALADVHVHPAVLPELQLVLSQAARAQNTQALVWAQQLNKDVHLKLVAPASNDDKKLRRALGHLLHDVAQLGTSSDANTSNSAVLRHLSSVLHNAAASARHALHACKVPGVPKKLCLHTVVAITLDGRFRSHDCAFDGLVPDYLAQACPNMKLLNLASFRIKQYKEKPGPSKLKRLLLPSSAAPTVVAVPQVTTLRLTKSIIVDISAIMQQLQVLPNLDTLSLHDSCIHELLWITQRQVVSQLTALAFVGRSNAKRFMRSMADGDPFHRLRKLTLSCCLFGVEVGRVLRAAPCLTALSVDSIVDMELTENFTRAACTWEALHVEHLHMDVISHLPLASVRHLECKQLSVQLWWEGPAASKSLQELRAACGVMQDCGGLRCQCIDVACKWRHGAGIALWRALPEVVDLLVKLATPRGSGWVAPAKLMCQLRGSVNHWWCWELRKRRDWDWCVEFSSLPFDDERATGEVVLHFM